MPTLPDANKPFAPFYQPVPVPVPGPFDAPLVCVQVNQTWMTYILGALQVLLAASTWDSDDENVVQTTIHNARQIVQAFMDFEACPMPIQFRNNPTQPINFDYSLDGGTTWTPGPDQAAHMTATFTPDSTAPGGYDISVNGGQTTDQIPLLTADDPEAVIKAPTSGDENVIEATATDPGLVVQGTQLGVALARNGASIQLQKIQDLGNLAEAIVDVVETGDYGTAILNILTAI